MLLGGVKEVFLKLLLETIILKAVAWRFRSSNWGWLYEYHSNDIIQEVGDIL